jgi:hypothetical protein
MLSRPARRVGRLDEPAARVAQRRAPAMISPTLASGLTMSVSPSEQMR